jgi:predicted metalloprotease with PDZ domain
MRTPTPSTPAVTCQISVADLHGHRFAVALRVNKPASLQKVSLPVWIPGSYLVREFAKNLLSLSARQGDRVCTVTQVDKCTWLVDCDSSKPLELRYEVYAFDNSVRTAWLDSQRGFFNGTSLCLAVEGHTDSPHALRLTRGSAPKHWAVATGLPSVAIDAKGFGTYAASNYDELVDCPVEMGDFWRGEFKACGIPHRFVVAGAPPSFDGERLLDDTRKICETELRFWHGSGTAKSVQKAAPFKQYVFMLNAVDDGYGGLEHRNSTALICTRKDLPKQQTGFQASEGYTTLLGLISHEYFHTWNVKRLRPTAFTRYDYTQENYTELLWFFEGFTSYYDDLLLRRAGLIDDSAYLKLLSKTINQVLQTPGRAIQSLAQSSFDAWVKYYRVDENTPNITVSYYTKGALAALCFDLSLRKRGTSLDHVMRALWQRCAAGPLSEADFAAELQAASGTSYEAQLKDWVHGTVDLPLQSLLIPNGVEFTEEPVVLAQQLGLRASETQGLVVKNVLRGGLAEQAGLAAGDEVLAVNDWRVHQLNDLLLYAGPAQQVTLTVSRDKRLLRLPLTVPQQGSKTPLQHSVRLSVQDAARVSAWTGG